MRLDELCALAFEDGAASSTERLRAFDRLLERAPVHEHLALVERGLDAPHFAIRHRAMHAAIAGAERQPSLRALVSVNLPRFASDAPTVLAAAAVLGEDGTALLLALAFESDATIEPALRREALVTALTHVPEVEHHALLERALASGHDALQTLAIERLVALGAPPSALRLRELTTDAPRTRLVAITRALSFVPGPTTELVLFELLEHRDATVQRLALEALAHAGSTRSLEPLRAWRAARLAAPRELRDAADDAERSLLARGRAAAGGLSLGESMDDAGRLSLTRDDPTGALSTATTSTPFELVDEPTDPPTNLGARLRALFGRRRGP
ncbi:hypothetical protein L6R52_05155 [Myxococcota bacterium]|nr:hypothetical protein [Myxococcota bacterium]